MKSGCYRIPKLPPLSVKKNVCLISHKTNHPIMIPKFVLKSMLWRDSESALNSCIFQLLCFSLHPIVHGKVDGIVGVVVHIVHAMVCYGFMDHLGMSLCRSWFMPYIASNRKLFRWVAKELKLNVIYLLLELRKQIPIIEHSCLYAYCIFQVS